MDQVKTKRLCFGYFCRLVTSALTFIPRTTYIYIFQSLFRFMNFLATCSEFWKRGLASFSFMLNVEEIERDFWRLHVLVCNSSTNLYTEITSHFFEVSYRRVRS